MLNLLAQVPICKLKYTGVWYSKVCLVGILAVALLCIFCIVTKVITTKNCSTT